MQLCRGAQQLASRAIAARSVKTNLEGNEEGSVLASLDEDERADGHGGVVGEGVAAGERVAAHAWCFTGTDHLNSRQRQAL